MLNFYKNNNGDEIFVLFTFVSKSNLSNYKKDNGDDITDNNDNNGDGSSSPTIIIYKKAK